MSTAASRSALGRGLVRRVQALRGASVRRIGRALLLSQLKNFRLAHRASRARNAMPLPNDGQSSLSPFKSDAERWETAFWFLYRLAKEYPELRKEFRIQWALKYEIPYEGPPRMQN